MKNYINRKCFGLMAWLGCLFLASPLLAQDFPAHEVNMIVN